MQERAYTEIAEGAEFTEKRNPSETQDPGKKPNLGHPQAEKRNPRAQSGVTVPQGRKPKTQVKNRTWGTHKQRREAQEKPKRDPRPRHKLRAWGNLRVNKDSLALGLRP
jgi:hypothetical protein